MSPGAPVRKKHDGASGHTLWEMLLVLALLGMVATLAIPALRPMRARAEDPARAVREIVALLEETRLTALERGTTLELRLDPAGGRAWVLAMDGDSLLPILSAVVTPFNTARTDKGSTRPSYTLLPSGEILGEPLVVQIPGGTRRISVDPWTGGVHVGTR
jgi:type II secretory pathway pseudopilin PulG